MVYTSHPTSTSSRVDRLSMEQLRKKTCLRVDIYLDEGLVADILARLPTKSVLRFRAVCKEWLRIIDSPAFVAAHARRCPLEVLLYTRTTVDSVDQQGLDALDVCAHRPATRRPLALFPGRDSKWQTYCSLLASCDGLLLLRNDVAVVDGAEQYLICNPATRQWSDLPRLSRGAGQQHGRHGRATHRESGFYFHELSGEFRLLCHVTFLGQAPYYCVFTAGANEPRRLSVKTTAIEHTIIAADQATMAGNQCFRNLMTPAVLHGQLHWLEHMEAGRTDQMVAFDTAAETFRRMPPPVTRKEDSHLLVADGALMAAELGEQFLDLWFLEGYGGGAAEGTWERRHRVDMPWLITRPLLVAGGDGGDVVLGHNHGVVAYNLRSGTVRQVVDADASGDGPLLPSRYVFRESLVRHGFFEARPHPGLPKFRFSP